MSLDLETIGIAFDTSGLVNGQRALKDTETAANKTADAADAAGKKGSKGLSDFGSAADIAKRQTESLAGATDVLSKAIDLAAKAYAAFKVYEYIKDATLLNARYETLGISMTVVGKNAGYTASQMEDAALALQKTGISMIESRQQAMRLVQAHIDLKDSSKLARIAQDAAVIGNMNSSEAFATLVHGIQTAQSETLRTIGINVNMEQSYKTMAQSLHKHADQLTQNEKTQAILNAVISAGADIAGVYTAAMDTAGKQLNSMKRYTEDLKTMQGEVFNEVLTVSVMAYTKHLKDANGEVSELAKNGELKAWGEDLAGIFVSVANAIDNVLNGIKMAGTWLAHQSAGGEINKKYDKLLVTNSAEFPFKATMEGTAERHAKIEQLRAQELASEQKMYEESQIQLGKNTDRMLQAYEERQAAKLAKQVKSQADSLAKEQDYNAKVLEVQKAYAGYSLDIQRTAQQQLAKSFFGDNHQYKDPQAEIKKIKEISIHAQAAHAVVMASVKAEKDLRSDLEKDMQAFTKNQFSRTKDLTKSIIDGINEQSKAYLAFDKSLDDHAESMRGVNELSQLEFDLMGRSSVERATLIEQKKIELALEKQLREIRASNMSEGEKNLLIDKANSQAIIDKSTAQLRAEQQEWSKFYGDIYNGLTDSLYRSFESGKSFGKTFIDSIKNLFKTTVLKLTVQGIVTSVLGMGANGMANAQGLGAQGNSLSSLTSMYSAGKSLWDGFSAAGTVGGGVVTLGNALGSSTISAFGSGMSLSSSQAASAAAAYKGAGMTGTGTAIGAGQSVGAALPIIGWVLAGMAANNSLYDKGWGGKASTGTKQAGIASGMVGGALESTIQKLFGLSDKSASMWSGSAVVNRLFGHQLPQLQQSELTGSFNAQSGVNASIRDVFKQRGGVFRGDIWSETKTAVGGDQAKELATIFDSIKLAASGYAQTLGLSTDALSSFSKDFKVNLSITGDAAKDAEANKKIWSDLIVGVADDLSKYLMPNLADFAKEGEKSGDTFARIAANLGGVNAVFSDLNLTLFKVNDLGIKAASGFVDLFGGLDKFQAASQSYYQNFYTQEERNANVVKSLTAELEKQNLVLPSSRDGYRALVDEVSKTGTPEQLASLFKLSDAFASVFASVDDAAVKVETEINQQMLAQQRLSAASVAATQALEQQAKATAALERATARQAYDDALQGRLRAGKVGEIMASNYALNPVSMSTYVNAGQFDAAGFNSEIIRQRAKVAIDLANKASSDAINVEDIAGVLKSLFEFTKDGEFENELRRSLPANARNQVSKTVGYVFSDFIDASITGMRLDQYTSRGQGITSIIAAQEDLQFQSDLQTSYSRSLSSANAMVHLGIITQEQYQAALADANKILVENVRSQDVLNAAIKEAGINSIAFYFDQIGLSVERLNQAAEKASEPLAVVTSAIGRFTSIGDVFSLSANAAGDVGGNADLVAQSAKIAAQVLTTQSAAQAAKELATKASFSGQSASQLRDFSLLIEGVKQFDPSSFEAGFLRISDALNKGSIDQAQYQDLFSASLNMFNGVEYESTLLAKTMGDLRASMISFADSLLIDKSKTTLSDAARMQEVMRQYDAAKVGAMTGDASSISLFQSLGNQLASKENYSSRAEANYGFSRVLADSQMLVRYADQKTSGEKQTAAIQSMEKSMNERMDKQFAIMLAQLKELQDANVNQVRASLPA